jgi:hypothetical protein
LTISPATPALRDATAELIGTPDPNCFSHTRVGCWNVFEVQCTPEDTGVADGLGAPGLWKTVRRASGRRRVFEFPDWVLPTSAEDDEWSDVEGRADIETYFSWAREVADGRVPHGWHPPVASVARAWLPAGALTLHTRGLLRQGRMILAQDRWAVRMPVVEQVSSELPGPRRRALEDLLHDAQSRWAMVRLGFHAQPGEAAVVAEVDLSGAPHRESLLLAALEALRSATAWVVEPAELLADLRVEISALALCFNNQEKGQLDEARK